MFKTLRVSSSQRCGETRPITKAVGEKIGLAATSPRPRVTGRRRRALLCCPLSACQPISTPGKAADIDRDDRSQGLRPRRDHLTAARRAELMLTRPDLSHQQTALLHSTSPRRLPAVAGKCGREANFSCPRCPVTPETVHPTSPPRLDVVAPKSPEVMNRVRSAFACVFQALPIAHNGLCGGRGGNLSCAVCLGRLSRHTCFSARPLGTVPSNLT